jgi:hypothetical protein
MKAYTLSSIIFIIACLSSVHLLSLEKSNSSRRCEKKNDAQRTINPDAVQGVRYVEVLSANGGDSWLQIAQLVVRDSQGVNIAKGKPASATSSWPGTSPANAVDGVEDSRNHPMIHHANKPNNEKFTVDLLKVSEVTSVELFNRKDCCQNRIIGARVRLLDTNRAVLREVVITGAEPKIVLEFSNTPIPAPIPANYVSNVRFVRVLSAQGPDSWLQISQLVVRNESGVNVARGKPASSSSNWPGTNPSTAVDGNEKPRPHPHEFHANGPNNQFFMVDLQNTENIKEIVYYNRTDCCTQRIIGARVQLLNENKQVIKEYTITSGAPSTTIKTI